MAIYRWHPSTDFDGLRNEMNRMFDNFFSQSTSQDPLQRRNDWRPSVDILEHEDAIHLIAELPGVPKDKIKLATANGVLTLSGEKNTPEVKKSDCYHCSERFFGAFERKFSLPTNVDLNKIQADYHDGILKIKLPKTEEAKPKEISIQAE